MEFEPFRQSWGSFAHRFESQYQLLLDYAALVEESIFAQFHKSAADLESEAEGLPDDETRQEFIDFHSDPILVLREEFPSLHRSSLLISAIRFFEHTLDEVCRKLTAESPSDISMTDLAGRGISRAKIFLSKIAGIEEPFKLPEWQRIQRYQDIRNVLVHQNGRLQRDNASHKRVYDFIRNEQPTQIGIDDLSGKWGSSRPRKDGAKHGFHAYPIVGHLVFGEGFLDGVVGDMQTFLAKLFASLDD